MLEEKFGEVNSRIEELKIEHRDLDEILKRLSQDRIVDELQIKRLKKRKLQLNDSIAYLESQASPEISNLTA